MGVNFNLATHAVPKEKTVNPAQTRGSERETLRIVSPELVDSTAVFSLTGTAVI